MEEKTRRALTGLAVGGTGGLVGYGVVGLGKDAIAETSGWALLGAFPVAPVLAVAVHELGHLVAGVLSGMRPVLYLVGPVQLEWRDGKRTWSVNRSVAMAGGLTVCLPPDGQFRKGAMSWYVAGGPGASFLLAISAFAAASLAPAAWVAPLSTVGLFSLAIGLVTAIPLPGALTNDATRFRMIRSGDERARRWLAVTSLTGLGMTGVRPRDWPADAVDLAAAPGPGSAADQAAGWLLAAYAYRDRGENTVADDLVERIEGVLQILPASLRLVFERECMAHALARGREPAVAAYLTDASRRGLLEEGWEVPRLQAWQAAARGRVAEQRSLAAAALERLGRSRMPGVARMIREELEYLARS